MIYETEREDKEETVIDRKFSLKYVILFHLTDSIQIGFIVVLPAYLNLQRVCFCLYRDITYELHE